MSTTGSGRAQPLLDDQIEPFLQHLREAGYAERTLRKKRTVARAFARWAKRKGIATIDLNDGHVDAFVGRLPRGDKSRLKFELAAVRLFLGHLRATANLQSPASQALVSPTASLLQQYENHLRKDRGLAENSLRVYLPLIRTFLASKLVSSGFPQSLKALSIRDFVIAQTRNRSAEYVRLLATALRSFCRFLFLSGHLAVDLASSVPRVCKYRQSTPPAFLAPEEVTRALAVTDRSTPRGRRDYAILLLLARLGLRAGEIVSLELDDVCWRTAEIVVHDHIRLFPSGLRGIARGCSTVPVPGRCAMTALRRELRQYIALRRALGTRLQEPAATLERFLDFLEREKAQFITSELALRWAMQPQGVQQATWARRLGMVRGFASWLSTIDSRTQVPPHRLLPSRRRRSKPHIFSPQEIGRLMKEASRLASSTGLRALTYTTLIGLLTATGLRPGEALALNNSDVDLNNGILSIRQSKFGKSRFVPLADSARAALVKYAKQRDKLCLHPRSEAFLISERGQRLQGCAARRTFARISCAVGVRPATGTRRIGRGPRLQDFRHCFATRKLIEWYRAGLDVGRELPKLATYLGHVDVAHTYWYLEAVPELLQLATDRLGPHRLGDQQ